MGAPGKIMRQTDEAIAAMLKYSAEHYVENWKRYGRDLKPVS
jgi:carbonic anhydrase/acetyltransferase-like protein (isoleucine patch superfamily)